MSTFTSTTTEVENGKLVTSKYIAADNVTSIVTVQSSKTLLSGNTKDNANTFVQTVLGIPVVSLPTNMTTVNTNNSTLGNDTYYYININAASPTINLPTSFSGRIIVIFNNSSSNLSVVNAVNFVVNSGIIVRVQCRGGNEWTPF
jgi:hypothetical protein